MASASDTSTDALVAALLSALAHDMRATVNGINVWTHILERVSDPTAARAVDGIRRSIAQQTHLAQELSDFGRDGFTAPGEAPADIGQMLCAVRDELRADVCLRLPGAAMYAAIGARALHGILRMTLRDALAGLSDHGRLDVAVDEAGPERWCIRIDVHDPEAADGDVPARRPLRQTLAMLCAPLHGAELLVMPGRRELLVPRARR